MIRWLVIFTASGAYTGYVPIAPGTAGAALGLVLEWFLAPLWQRAPAAFLIAFALIFVASCGIAGAAEKTFERHDSQQIVLDEVLGMVATLFLVPAGWLWIAMGFLLFRIFDTLKPWPASAFDRMKGGAGVMLDDLAAAIYANLMLQALRLIV